MLPTLSFHSSRLKLVAAFLLPFLAAGLEILFWEEIQPFAWIAFYPTVLCCAWLGGMAGGLVSTVISVLLVKWFFIPNIHSLTLANPRQAGAIVIFVMVGYLTSLLNHRCRLRATELVVAKGENPQHLAMVEDMMERTEADERLRCITDAAYDAILMMDPQGSITYWNPAAEQILGYPAEEALGKDLHDLLTPERYRAAFRAAYPEFLLTGRGNALGKTRDLFARHRDGHELPIALSLSAVRIHGAWHAVGVIRDISELKRAEA